MAAHSDSAIFSWYAYNLENEYERIIKTLGIDRSVLAYRSIPGKGTYNFATETFEFIRKSNDNVCALGFDIESFFDKINHRLLKIAYERVLGRKLRPDEIIVLKHATKYTFINTQDLKEVKDHKEKYRLCSPATFRNLVKSKNIIQKNNHHFGVAQGTPISAVLSNIYLLNFDQIVYNAAEAKRALYRRYSDDILVVCNVKDVKYFLKLISREIVRLKLKIQKTKTSKIYFNKNKQNVLTSRSNKGNIEPLQYLGLEFDGSKITLRSKTLAKFNRRFRHAAEIQRNLESKIGHKSSRKGLFQKYSHLGRYNFISYAKRVARETNDLSSRKQVKRHVTLIKRALEPKKNKN